MKPKSIIIELIIIAVTAGLTWLATALWFGNAVLDINLHDTYLVAGRATLVSLSCLPVIMLVYFVRAGYYKFKNRLCNGIALIANILLLIVWFILIRFLAIFSIFQAGTDDIVQGKNGWTIYPPLSALPKAMPQVKISVWETVLLNEQFQVIIFCLFLFTLIIITFLTGKNWNTKPIHAPEKA